MILMPIPRKICRMLHPVASETCAVLMLMVGTGVYCERDPLDDETLMLVWMIVREILLKIDQKAQNMAWRSCFNSLRRGHLNLKYHDSYSGFIIEIIACWALE